MLCYIVLYYNIFYYIYIIHPSGKMGLGESKIPQTTTLRNNFPPNPFQIFSTSPKPVNYGLALKIPPNPFFKYSLYPKPYIRVTLYPQTLFRNQFDD